MNEDAAGLEDDAIVGMARETKKKRLPESKFFRVGSENNELVLCL
jgi:hypothetical protein